MFYHLNGTYAVMQNWALNSEELSRQKTSEVERERAWNENKHQKE